LRKFFVETDCIKDGIIKILGTDVNHIKNVLRLKVSDKIEICNKDTSKTYLCEISEIFSESIECNIIEEIKNQTEGNVKLDIYQGIPKFDKMELIIQKGTELGVSRFIPLKLNRCIVKLDKKDELKKIDRWKKIAEVAAKQSMRDIVPQIGNIINIREISEVVNEYDVVLVAYELEKNNYIKNELLKIKDNKKEYKIAVIIGPEGGIEEKEIQVLKEIGCKIISLGKRILRTETVAINVSSIIMYELENGGN